MTTTSTDDDHDGLHQSETLRRIEADPLDRSTVDGIDTQHDVIVLDHHLVADHRQTSQFVPHEATERVDIGVVQVQTEPVVEHPEDHVAAGGDTAAFDDDRLLLEVELVVHLADDLLDRVLQRHHPRNGAVLVHNERAVLLLIAELAPERRDGEHLGDRKDRTA